MKKIALILAFAMLIPCSAFGMQMLSNSNMDKITGQAGVSIAFDDVQMFMNIEKIAYIDSDGTGGNTVLADLVAPSSASYGSGAGGAVGLNNFTLNLLNVNAIIGQGTGVVGAAVNSNAGGTGLTSHGLQAQYGSNMALASAGVIPLFYNYATGSNVGGAYLTGETGTSLGLATDTYIDPVTGAHDGTFIPRFLTIDVTNQLPAATAAFGYLTGVANTNITSLLASEGITAANHNAGGVLIGIPTMEVYISAMSLTPYYTGAINGTQATDDGAANDFNNAALGTVGLGTNANYGTIQMVGITFTTLSGWVEIAPH